MTTSAARSLRTLGLAAACLAAARAGPGDDVPGPSTAPPITDSLSTGDVRRHAVVLEAGEFARIEVVPDGIDVGVSLRGPDGTALVETTPRSGEARVLSVIARERGPHQLEIHALEDSPRQGRYVVAVKEQRPSGRADAARVKAAQALLEADRLWSDGQGKDAVERALRLYQESLDASIAAQDAAGRILAARKLGMALNARGTPREAITPLLDSLALSERSGDVAAECAALCALGWAEAESGSASESSDHADRALALSRRAGDRRCEAEALNVVAEVRTLTGRDTEAPPLYADALAISRAIRDRRGEAQTQLDLGYVMMGLSRFDEARAAYAAAIELWQSVGERRGHTRALLGLAQVSGIVGERQRALRYYRQARDMVDVLSDRWGEAVVESGLGMARYRLGEPEAAIPHYRAAVELFRNAKNPQGEAANLMLLAACLAAVGRHDEALAEQTRALTIARADSNLRLEARILHEIGQLQAAAGRVEEALATYAKALPLARTVGDVRSETAVLNGMGEALERQGRPDDARMRFAEALGVAKLGQDPFVTSTAQFGLARVEASRGLLPEALQSVQDSLALAEGLRAAVASLDLRASYVATIRERQELEIDLLTQLHQRDPGRGYDVLAFEASERARARSLLDGLADARGSIHEGASPALLQRETSLRERLNALAGQLDKMTPDARVGPQGVAMEKEVDQLVADHREIRARMRAESPRYASLVEPRPIGLAEVQKTIVDERSVLLQYFLGRRRSYVWAVSKTTLAGSVLPPRDAIEALVRPYSEELARPRPGSRRPRDAALAEERARAVSRLLLDPVAAHLDVPRVVVVADGILESLPFAVLPDPRRAEVPLVQEHEVVTLPSASTLSLIRGAWEGEKKWPKDLLVLADPVFEADDPRLVRGRPSRAGRTDSGTEDSLAAPRPSRAAGETQALPRLIGSRHEALSISALASSADVALGFEANRTKAMDAGVKDHRIVHFATHTVVDSARPELSGIVLSLFDESGAARDGFVRLHDVYNMTLPVDLVVLSGCSSALGKPLAGEGLISLVRGFMYAGTRRVLASLWRVDDEATSELMARFYRGLWKDGLSPSASLRAAQLGMMSERRWRDPFYWAAFVLSGDWDSGENDPNKR